MSLVYGVVYRAMIRNLSSPPVFSKSRRLDSGKLAVAKSEFATMEKAGIVRRSSSSWASPLLMVPKADDSWRPCGDYRRLNTVFFPMKHKLYLFRYSSSPLKLSVLIFLVLLLSSSDFSLMMRSLERRSQLLTSNSNSSSGSCLTCLFVFIVCNMQRYNDKADKSFFCSLLFPFAQ